MKRRAFALALLVLVFGPAARAAPPPSPLPPTARVASVLLCTDEYVYRLLPRARIAALSYLANDTHPIVSTLVGKVDGIRLIPMSAEALVAAKPNAVVLAKGASAEMRAVLKAAHIRIIDMGWANSLDGVRGVTRQLAAALGVPQKGEALIAKMDARLAAARAMAPKRPVRTLLYQPNGYTVAGGVSDAVMRAGGLIDIAPVLSPTRRGTVPVETVVADAPELLILGGAPGGYNSRAREVLHHPALAALDSHTHRQWMALTPLLCPGPWSADAALSFARAADAVRGLAAAPPHD